MARRCRPCSAVEGIYTVSGREHCRPRGCMEPQDSGVHTASTVAICKAPRGGASWRKPRNLRCSAAISAKWERAAFATFPNLGHQ